MSGIRKTSQFYNVEIIRVGKRKAQYLTLKLSLTLKMNEPCQFLSTNTIRSGLKGINIISVFGIVLPLIQSENLYQYQNQ